MPQPSIEAVTFGFHDVLANSPLSQGTVAAKDLTEVRGARALVNWASIKFKGNIAIIATASEEQQVKPFLIRYGLSGTVHNVFSTKAEAIEIFGKDTRQIAAIESTPEGINSAKNADLYVIGVAGPTHSRTDLARAGADFPVDSLAKIPGALLPPDRFPVAARGIQ